LGEKKRGGIGKKKNRGEKTCAQPVPRGNPKTLPCRSKTGGEKKKEATKRKGYGENQPERNKLNKKLPQKTMTERVPRISKGAGRNCSGRRSQQGGRSKSEKKEGFNGKSCCTVESDE